MFADATWKSDIYQRTIMIRRSTSVSWSAMQENIQGYLRLMARSSPDRGSWIQAGMLSFTLSRSFTPMKPRSMLRSSEIAPGSFFFFLSFFFSTCFSSFSSSRTTTAPAVLSFSTTACSSANATTCSKEGCSHSLYTERCSGGVRKPSSKNSSPSRVCWVVRMMMGSDPGSSCWMLK
eukprot:Lithocolla_globosa_v1_NODE_2453_length_1998_cov_21.430777.p3 type:complete len:177 gc:universal NODE_2453_length_1998_cov_21.430777:1089-559(-)